MGSIRICLHVVYRELKQGEKTQYMGGREYEAFSFALGGVDQGEMTIQIKVIVILILGGRAVAVMIMNVSTIIEMRTILI